MQRKRAWWLLAGLAAGAGWYISARRRAAMASEWREQLKFSISPTALVTGASSGIGEAYARALAARGYNLVLVARRADRLSRQAAEYENNYSVRVEVLPADLSTEAGIACVEQRLHDGPPVDFLVNAAGYDVFGFFVEIPIEDTLGLISVLQLAVVRLTRAALPGMIARRNGAVVNVSSIGAFGPKSRDSTYVAAKAYLNQFSESLWLELQGTGVRVQALCPGMTLTEFHDAPQYASYHLKERIPRWLWMTADEVVGASLRALPEDQCVVVPGLKYQLLAGAMRLGFTLFFQKLLRAFLRRRM